MSNCSYSIPNIFNWDFCIGNPGSMKRTLSLPGSLCVVAIKEENDDATDPVPGIHARGEISRFMKAFTNFEAASLSSATPAAAGYVEPTPASNALFSASTPILFAGRPGEPWSMRMNFVPVLFSRYEATSRTSPIVASCRFATSIFFVASATSSLLKISSLIFDLQYYSR